MSESGKLRLNLVDVYGDRLQDKVHINLRHRTLSDRRRAPNVDASKRIVIKDLRAAPQGLYVVEVQPSSYLPASQFANVKASGFTDITMTFPIDPKKVVKAEFPQFEELDPGLQGVLERSDDVLSFEGKKGKQLYDGLDDMRRAGLLNIAAKSFVTPFANGASFLPHITIMQLRGDRCFVQVPKGLREEVEHSVAEGTFISVDGSLHDPPDNFEPAGSFKTPDRYGNLQLTFFKNGDLCVADVDIDDAAGLGHVFQVLRNHLTGRPTHPYDIHEILVFHQHLDPGYKLLPHQV